MVALICNVLRNLLFEQRLAAQSKGLYDVGSVPEDLISYCMQP